MGLEAKCRAKCGRQPEVTGKLHLDSTELSFVGGGIKWNTLLRPAPAAKVAEGWLIVGAGRNVVSFELGATAHKWLDKIQNPPSRLDKLGLKPGQACFLLGKFEQTFLSELKKAKIGIVKSVNDCQLALALIQTRKELKQLSKTVDAAVPRTHLWIVWPKGSSEIEQDDIFEFTKDHGMGPSKACAFDTHLTAMRFMKK